MNEYSVGQLVVFGIALGIGWTFGRVLAAEAFELGRLTIRTVLRWLEEPKTESKISSDRLITETFVIVGFVLMVSYLMLRGDVIALAIVGGLLAIVSVFVVSGEGES